MTDWTFSWNHDKANVWATPTEWGGYQPILATYTADTTFRKRLPKRYPSARGYGRKR